ncbi:MAG: thiolase domain-containing protein [Aliidiomarina sp.]|uniref:acetyl-CoA acetyltransferase n=1 Tax=Aliidiomarina sp. TaxID=1872439 RepID=UPI0025C3EF41|nr:acetyl-CoA acetyltransferase [Aliidiomarina sp.]MCH8501192.1 thiolase domain-containing protein [Aliidiomarina sp.]
MKPIFILGGAQSDFARNLAREGLTLFDLFSEVTADTLHAAKINAEEIGVCHVGNFVSDLFTGQAHLGGFFAEANSGFYGTPSTRHEAACASGSVAVLAAIADIQSGHYDTALVLGIEQMKNVPGVEAAAHLSAAAWRGKEHVDATYLWPAQFAELADVYQSRYSLKREWLTAISANAFANAALNSRAQTRSWTIGPEQLGDNDAFNPRIEGQLRKQDCGQVTDGAAGIVLASESAARQWAKRHGLRLDQIPRISGWGHTSAAMRLSEKLRRSVADQQVFPHVRKAFTDAMHRASLTVDQLAGIELHDCFSITGYMLLDHLGIEQPGEAWKIIERGVSPSSQFAVNPSGGLIGLGHPVGATGVRMLLDAALQVSNQAGSTQVHGAKHFATLNVGGSTTTVVSFMVSQ